MGATNGARRVVTEHGVEWVTPPAPRPQSRPSRGASVLGDALELFGPPALLIAALCWLFL